MANNNMLYGIVVVVAILVIVGAVIAMGVLSPTTYDVTVSLAANNSAGTIYPYQTSVFNMTITNMGSKEIVGLPVAFYINGNQKNYSSYTIPVHQSVSVHQTYIYSQPGQYLFTAAADPGNVLNIVNRGAAKKNLIINVSAPQQANIYSSVPNSNIIYTDSFTASGTGLMSGSTMASLYSIGALTGIIGADNSILAKSYQDLQPYVAVGNGAYSIYANGTASYASWLQGTLTPKDLAAVIGSFGKKIGPISTPSGSVEFSALTNSISLCSYYQNGWTKIIEINNNSGSGTCLALVGNSYNASENNAIVNSLKGTRLGATTTSNQLNASTQIPWQKFYYNNATVLGQMVEYSSNSIAASTLFQLSSPPGVFLSSIRHVYTNVSQVNSTCLGLESAINGISICSIVIPLTTTVGNQTYGTVHSSYISTNYTVSLYSLISQNYFTLAHENALQLIGELGVPGNSVSWQSPFKNTCAFLSGFGCKFNGFGQNGTVNVTITNLNYSSVSLENITCTETVGFGSNLLNGTLVRGSSVTIMPKCHGAPSIGLVYLSSLDFDLGFRYGSSPLIVNGTLNVTTGG